MEQWIKHTGLICCYYWLLCKNGRHPRAGWKAALPESMTCDQLLLELANSGQLHHGNDGDNGWKAALPESMTCDWLLLELANPGQLFHGNDGDNGWKAALPESMTCDWLLLELANSGQRFHSNDGYNGFAFPIQVKQHVLPVSGTVMCMCPANERWRYIVMPIGLAHTCTQNDPCVSKQPPDDDMGELEHSYVFVELGRNNEKTKPQLYFQQARYCLIHGECSRKE